MEMLRKRWLTLLSTEVGQKVGLTILLVLFAIIIVGFFSAVAIFLLGGR